MRRSSMTFKITPVCRLKHSGTNGRYKKKKRPAVTWNGSILQRGREREGRGEKRQVQNVDAEIERGRDATLSRLILKFCTQEPAVNHTRTRRGWRKKKKKGIICLVYEWGNNMDAQRATSLASGVVRKRKRTRTEKKGRHRSFVWKKENRKSDGCWMSFSKLGTHIQCGVQVFRSIFPKSWKSDRHIGRLGRLPINYPWCYDAPHKVGIALLSVVAQQERQSLLWAEIFSFSHSLIEKRFIYVTDPQTEQIRTHTHCCLPSCRISNKQQVPRSVLLSFQVEKLLHVLLELINSHQLNRVVRGCTVSSVRR